MDKVNMRPRVLTFPLVALVLRTVGVWCWSAIQGLMQTLNGAAVRAVPGTVHRHTVTCGMVEGTVSALVLSSKTVAWVVTKTSVGHGLTGFRQVPQFVPKLGVGPSNAFEALDKAWSHGDAVEVLDRR